MNPAHATAVPLQRFLVAVDLEGFSDHAVAAALELARLLDGRVEFVHAVSSPSVSWQLIDDACRMTVGADLVTLAKQHLARRLRDQGAAEAHRERSLEDALHVEVGRPAKVIVERAQETSADCVVLGALHRRSTGSVAADFGSTARAVLAKSPCAVWTQPTTPTPIRDVLVAVDLSQQSLDALATARELALRSGARVRALNVLDDAAVLASASWTGVALDGALAAMATSSARAFEDTMASFDWRGVAHEHAHATGPVVDTILDRAWSSDLIVIGTHGTHACASAVLGSVAYAVLRRARLPVLAVRSPRKAA